MAVNMSPKGLAPKVGRGGKGLKLKGDSESFHTPLASQSGGKRGKKR